jgi:membrane protein implicated in regulation of membrane protease activity
MRRLDVFSIGLGVFLAGGAIYFLLQVLGIDAMNAGIWSQALLVVGLVGWVLTYLVRFATSNLTYNQQLRDYENAIVEKRWEKMTPEEREQVSLEVLQEQAAATVSIAVDSADSVDIVDIVETKVQPEDKTDEKDETTV